MNSTDLALVWLACGWVGWCLIHSLLIWPGVEKALKKAFPVIGKSYRLLYNLLAVATVVPLVWYDGRISGSPLFSSFLLTFVQTLFLLTGLLLLGLGALAYPMKDFLGFSFSRREENRLPLITHGVLTHIRHPWYTGAFLLLWSRFLSASHLVTAAVLSLYLLVGVRLEEVKLKQTYGQAYETYQAQVPRFFPRLRRKRLP